MQREKRYNLTELKNTRPLAMRVMRVMRVLSQNTVLLNEQKVKLCLLLCLDFELNAYKDIKLQPTTLQLDHHSFTKRNNSKSVFANV